MVALTNELAGSDGDIFSHTFKLLKLGPLVGKRTWGGVIGIWPRHTLADGTLTTQPEFSFYFDDVGWNVENYGTDPDIEVDNRRRTTCAASTSSSSGPSRSCMALLTGEAAAHPAAHPGPEHGPAGLTAPHPQGLGPDVARCPSPDPSPLRGKGCPVSEFPSPPKRGGGRGGALRGLLDVEQLDLEEQRRVRRDDAAGAARAVAELAAGSSGVRMPPTFMPATPSSQPLMTWPRAELERERLAAILRAVELLAVGEPAGVVDGDRSGRPSPRRRCRPWCRCT